MDGASVSEWLTSMLDTARPSRNVTCINTTIAVKVNTGRIIKHRCLSTGVSEFELRYSPERSGELDSLRHRSSSARAKVPIANRHASRPWRRNRRRENIRVPFLKKSAEHSVARELRGVVSNDTSYSLRRKLESAKMSRQPSARSRVKIVLLRFTNGRKRIVGER